MRSTGAVVIFLMLALTGVRAGDDGLAGNWKLSLLDDGNPVPVWLVKLQSKGGKLTGSADGLRRMPSATVDDARIEGDRLYFTLNVKTRDGAQSFTFEGLLPKAGGKKILGSIPWGDDESLIPAQLELTTAKDGFEVEKELVTRSPNDPRVLRSVQELIAKAAERKVPVKEVQEWLDVAFKAADKHGPRFAQETAMRYGVSLLNKEGYAKAAVDAARRAEKLLSPKDNALDQLATLDLLAAALRKAGDKVPDELDARVAKLESAGREEHHKKLLWFKTDKFEGRKAKGNRAVLVELFTGAQCPPCIAADVAFDALAKTYAPAEVILLQYHEHIPLPDALTNAATVARLKYYEVEGTPALCLNGQETTAVGGALQVAEQRYKSIRKHVETLLEKPAAATIKLDATRTGNQIAVKVAAGVETPGAKVKLRVALVEEWVRYRGRNSLSYHHHVVRDMPSGAQGVALSKKTSDHTFDVDLERLRASLNKYLDAFNKGDDGPLLDDQRPMRMQNLRVVAFIQNDDTREVLQAVEVVLKNE
jgi:hypothetical protein